MKAKNLLLSTMLSLPLLGAAQQVEFIDGFEMVLGYVNYNSDYNAISTDLNFSCGVEFNEKTAISGVFTITHWSMLAKKGAAQTDAAITNATLGAEFSQKLKGWTEKGLDESVGVFAGAGSTVGRFYWRYYYVEAGIDGPTRANSVKWSHNSKLGVRMVQSHYGGSPHWVMFVSKGFRFGSGRNSQKHGLSHLE